jgi:arylmalonate decarboxylase
VNANKEVVQRYIDSIVISDRRIRQDKAGTIVVAVERWIEDLKPRFHWGFIRPRNPKVDRGGAYQFYQLVPRSVMEIGVHLGIKDYGEDDIEEAIARYWQCIDLLASEQVDAFVLGGAPISAQLGQTRVRQLLSKASERIGVPGYAPLEAMTAAVQHLGLRKVAIASRWAAEVNDALAGYLEEGGLQVVSVTTRGQWAKEAHEMTLEQGMQTALDVAREAAAIAPDAEAILAPGGATLTLHVVRAIEEELGKPAITNLTAELWQGLVHTGVIEPLQNWGRLLASR